MLQWLGPLFYFSLISEHHWITDLSIPLDLIGAAACLARLGFPQDPTNPSMAALAFEVSYDVMERVLGSSTGNHPRFLPADHEHRLCKLKRFELRIQKARGGDRIRQLARRFLEPDDIEKCKIDATFVQRRLDSLNGKMFLF